MLRNSICVIGTGGAGNILANELANIDHRYITVFCNTNLSEMEGLDNFKPELSIYFASANGTGRDRELVKDLIKSDQARIFDFFREKFSPSSGVENFFIISSSDGGSGSGSTPMLARVIKKVNPNATVNLLLTAPSLKERELSLNNFKALWNDVVGLRANGIISSVQFIDNNKMGRDEHEFNVAVMEEFDNSLSITNEVIDNQDSKKVNTASGYKVVLTLEKNTSLQSAIDKAVKNSNFLMPSSFDCDFLMATFDQNDFNRNDCKDLFDVFELDKYDYNEDELNMIVLGGCKMPKDYVELVDIALQDLISKKKSRTLDDDLIVSVETTKEVVTTTKTTKVKRKDLKKMMEDDSFWD